MLVPGDIFATWLPIVAAVLMGIIGLVRGFGRELVVSAALVLSALIVQQWGDNWASGVHDVFPAAGLGWSRFVLGTITLIGVTLLSGYLLGGRLAERPTSAGARFFGGLLGAANGAALAGWLLREAYVGLDSTQPSSPVYQNSVSQGFMIWAGWFPLILAVLGALYAILSPLRRAQKAVASPSSKTDWAPAPVTAKAASAGQSSAETRLLPVFVPSSSASQTSLPVRAADPPSSVPQTEDTSIRRHETAQDGQSDLPSHERITEAAPVVPMDALPTEASWLGGRDPGTSSAPATTSFQSIPGRSASQLPEAKRCKQCGAPLQAGAAFCTECGMSAT